MIRIPEPGTVLRSRKTCPFCGAADAFVGAEEKAIRYSFRCDSCDVRGQVVLYMSGKFMSKYHQVLPSDLVFGVTPRKHSDD